MSVFTKSAVSSVFAKFKAGEKAAEDYKIKQDSAIQALVDQMILACDKPKAQFMAGNAKTNPARAEVKALFYGLMEAGYIGKSAADNYATSFWIAFEQGVPYQRGLFTGRKPEVKRGAKSGKVSTTDNKALIKTLAKAIEQARTLKLDAVAAGLVDLAQEIDPEFTE